MAWPPRSDHTLGVICLLSFKQNAPGRFPKKFLRRLQSSHSCLVQKGGGPQTKNFKEAWVELSRLQVQENSGQLGAQRLLSLFLPLMFSSSVCLCRATDIIEPILNATNSPASTLSEEAETRDVATQDLRREEWRAENRSAGF